jgi:hypothetical protein
MSMGTSTADILRYKLIPVSKIPGARHQSSAAVGTQQNAEGLRIALDDSTSLSNLLLGSKEKCQAFG